MHRPDGGVWSWSDEVRVMLQPGRAIRALEAATPMRDYGLIRRPLFLLFLWGCTVSLQTSGRFGVRLIADGMVSFAFVPLVQVAALAIAAGRRPKSLPFAALVDIFFAGNGPWLLWFMAVGVLRSIETPVAAASRPASILFAIDGTAMLAWIWSAYVDWCFFRDVLARPSRRAFQALVVQRAIGWTVGFVYFFGIAAWPLLVGMVYS
jgi:hypothetical protein